MLKLKNPTLLFFILCSLLDISFSQLPVINWQNSIGGIGSDQLEKIASASDGGCLLVGYSNSNISGDKTENTNGIDDYWIIKINVTGSIEWQNTIGGLGSDKAYAGEQTADGGYIVGGISYSGISGDKTSAHIGSGDYWIVKLNASGAISWQQTIGGSNIDELHSIHQLSDGNYIVGGSSKSGISGNKTNASKGGYDYWILKLDPSGNILWQKTIGSSDDDLFSEIEPVSTGGFIVGGSSAGNISGDKSETSSSSDYWVLKLDDLGNIIWQQTIKGLINESLADLVATSDGGFVLAGSSDSPISYDKSENAIGPMIGTLSDYWIIKLNASGIKEWDNTIGGTGGDSPNTIIETTDGYAVAGTSSSSAYGDKHNSCYGGSDLWVIYLDYTGNLYAQITAGGIYSEQKGFVVESEDSGFIIGTPASGVASGNKTENSNGATDYWILKLDSALIEFDYSVEWQDTIGGISDDIITSILQNTDGSYLVGGRSKSGISGEKTEACIGDFDYWVVKYSNDGNVLWQNTIGGSGADYLQVIKTTSDGGYILGGYSISPTSGDKIENSTSNDYWIIKIDALGNIQWQNTIGGSGNDNLKDLIVLPDGNFIVAGTSASGIGGDKTEASIGAEDYWIIKFDPTGNILWQNTIGGNLSDNFSRIVPIPDGGFLLTGYSLSGISGDKTSANKGDYDYWVVKIDEGGNVLWDKSYGSSLVDYFGSVVICPDGFLLGGYSGGNISYDKTENNSGAWDLWFVKTDFDGNILWDNTFGGPGYDYLIGYNLQYDLDNGFTAISFTDSDGGGDKWTLKSGCTDIWLLKFDSLGNNLWQEKFGDGSCEAVYGAVYTANDNGIIMGITTDNDYWTVKLIGSCTPTPELCNSLDDNCNGLIDDGITETISISAGGPTTFCQGGSVVLSAIYSGATVQWKKDGVNIAGATSANYTVTKKGNYTCVTTSPCGTATSSIINVVVNKNPAAGITAAGATTFCAGGSVTLTEIASPGCTYQWYKGASAIAGATSTNYIATTTGNYKCRVTKTATGCYKNSNAIAVSVPCREDEINSTENNSFTLFPNPANDKLNIQIESQLLIPFSFLLTITDLEGRMIYTRQINSSTTEINISDFASGMYFVKVKIGDNEMIEKFIKN